MVLIVTASVEITPDVAVWLVCESGDVVTGRLTVMAAAVDPSAADSASVRVSRIGLLEDVVYDQ
jgi:hypothetical protein